MSGKAYRCTAERHASTVLQIKDVVKQLYRGGSSYVTRCRQCENESAHSSSVSDFFELDLQVCVGAKCRNPCWVGSFAEAFVYDTWHALSYKHQLDL